MRHVRVLVIDDSAFMRKVIPQLLSVDDRIDVVATARNGEDGLRKIAQLEPDVITLDVEMPIMDGITTLEKIMKQFPTPVIMVSSMTPHGAQKTVQAMHLGAVDFIEKPSGSISLDMQLIQSKMIQTVVNATTVDVTKVMRNHVNIRNEMSTERYRQSIVAIGTSTGGPRALQSVLTSLSKSFPVPIVIVQHMPPRFTKSLADRLNTLCAIHVKEAEHGELLNAGVAYIAPGDEHMHVRQVGTSLAIQLHQHEPRHGHRPAVDELFESIAPLKRLYKMAIILTGMGRDGSKGIERIKEHDPQSIVIVESSETALVYGMPRSAIATNRVDTVVPLHDIGGAIINCIKR